MRTIIINRKDFNHGKTRNIASSEAEGDILVFLTQDAVLADNTAVENLIRPFYNGGIIGASYGRQVPRIGAGAIEAHARLFNYPETSSIKTLSDAPILGLKTAFISNSFAAYRREALTAVGGFPLDTILCEDVYVTAKMLLAGWNVAYCADAMVFHSHDYGLIEEFRRYFDIGVFHAREEWIRKNFGQAEGEGLRYIRSELDYLWNTKPQQIPSAILRSLFKFLGYKFGGSENIIPIWLKSIMSMNRLYWESEAKLGLMKC